jgi:hypothetical protein
MKKSLFLALLLALAFTGLKADSVGSPTSTTFSQADRSIIIPNHRTLALGGYAGSLASFTMPFTTDVNTNIGDVMVFTTNTTNGISVSETTSVGDVTWAGIAAFPYGVTWTPAVAGAAAGVTNTINVAIMGPAIAKIAVNVVKGDLLISSGTAGYLTESAAGTGAVFTNLSRTAIVAKALETVNVVAGAGLCRVWVKP